MKLDTVKSRIQLNVNETQTKKFPYIQCIEVSDGQRTKYMDMVSAMSGNTFVHLLCQLMNMIQQIMQLNITGRRFVRNFNITFQRLKFLLFLKLTKKATYIFMLC